MKNNKVKRISWLAVALLTLILLLSMNACQPAAEDTSSQEHTDAASGEPVEEPTNPPPVAAASPAPQEVVVALGETLNAADLDGTMALIDEDMVFDVAGDELIGQDAVRGLFEELIAGNFRIQYAIRSVDGDTVTTETRTWGDGIPQGAEPNVAEETYAIKDGRIASISWMPTEETLSKLTAVGAVHELGAAINNGDAAAAMAFIASDVVFDSNGELHEGSAEVQSLFEDLIAGDFRIEQEVTDFDGSTVTTNTTTWGAGMPPQIEPLQAVEEYVIEDGKIVSITWTPTAESAAKLAAVMAEFQAVEIITAVNEAWNAGDVDTLKALYAADGEMCAPDWGPDCNTGEEELAEWIEGLVSVNFEIEPQSLEVEASKIEGDIVTVVAKVWADPSRALEIAPLVTTDVYTIKDGQILSQISTLDEESAAKLAAAMEAAQEPPEPTPTPSVPLASSPEEILGAWKWTAGRMSIRFDDNGTARMAYKPEELQGAPYYTFSYTFDGTKMGIKEIEGFGVAPCKGTVGSYEVQLLESGNIQLVVIEDDCGRVGDIPGEYEPLD